METFVLICLFCFILVLFLRFISPGACIRACLTINLVSKLVFEYFSFKKTCMTLKKIPGYSKGHWLFGNYFQRYDENYRNEILDWAAKSGYKITKEWIGNIPCVNIHHPHPLMNNIKTPRDYRFYRATCPWIGKASAFASGKSRVEKQKLLMNTFSVNITDTFTHVYSECVNILITKWNTGQAIQVVPLNDDISTLVIDILLRCMYSFQSNCQTKPSQYSKAIKSVQNVMYQQAFSESSADLCSDVTFLYSTWKGWKLQKNCRYLHKMTQRFIIEHKKELKNTHSVSNMDLLDSFLVHNTCNLTNTEIQNEMDSLMFWGAHTTTAALMWTLYRLAKHPELQEKCRKEVSNHTSLKHLWHEDFSKFHYTRNFIQETLRWHPPIQEIFRSLPADTVIDDFLVPKNATLCFKILSIHFNPDCWTNPDLFDPMRFSSEDVHPYAYLPFSVGPRNCVGEDFAMKITLVASVIILKKFSLVLAEQTESKKVEDIMITIKPISH